MSGGYEVGKYGYICVGIGGTVEAVTNEAVTINGTSMPRLGAGSEVRYISSEPPPEPGSPVYCESCLNWQDEMDRDSLRWSDLIRAEHDDAHDDAWVLCSNRLCMEAQGR